MTAVVINVLIFVLWTVVCWRRQRCLDVYLFVTLLYTFTALMCGLYYAQYPNVWHSISLFPFLYMFGVIKIMLRPLSKLYKNHTTMELTDSPALNKLAIFYLLLAGIDIVTSLPDTIEMFRDGNWGILREQLYADEESIVLYQNQFQRMVKNLLGYISPFALVYAFIQLSKPKINPLFTIFLFVAVLLPSFMAATIVASRGAIVVVTLKLGICYILFKNTIPQNRKIFIFQMGLLLLAGYLTYSIIVSISRFGQEEAANSVFMYFGHSMLTFNQGIYNSMDDYAWGKRFFSWFIDALGGDSSFSSVGLGSTAGTGFLTIVGCMFVDWGPIGTIVAAVIANKIVSPFCQKQLIKLSDSIVIVFYASTLAEGIMVFGRGRALAWATTFALYFIIKKLEKTRRNNGTIYSVLSSSVSSHSRE